MMLDPSRDEPDVSLDLPEVSKHNWKELEIRDAWDDPLESFVEGRREVAQRALLDEDHPRKTLRRLVPTERASDIVADMSEEIDVARAVDDDKTTLMLTSPDCPADPETLLDWDVSPIDQMKYRGVPDCCATALTQHRANGQHDPIVAIARNTPSTEERGGELVVEDPHPILNPIWAYQGWSFVDFYPCSFECDRAREFASETGRLFREIGRDEAAEAAYEFLTEPTYWSGYHGLAHVKNSWCIGEYNTDDYWKEEVVRFNGYHDEVGDVSSIDFNS
ncbi:hypothetical protein [Halorussus aquaticus]|uniref:Uncharacterized protein n=1 Tax=Halorussus aquaticus TaxID=2953748 RepID=A0ABD5Q8Y1_9EURY|nr:hypothetical protein [Halorussus aquaticus]